MRQPRRCHGGALTAQVGPEVSFLPHRKVAWVDIRDISRRAGGIFWHERDLWYYGAFTVLPGSWPGLLLIAWQFRPTIAAIEQMSGVVSADGLISLMKYQIATPSDLAITYQQTLFSLLALGLFGLLLIVGGTVARAGIIVWVDALDRLANAREQRAAERLNATPAAEAAAEETAPQVASEPITGGVGAVLPPVLGSENEPSAKPQASAALAFIARDIEDGGVTRAAGRFWAILGLDALFWVPGFGLVVLLSMVLAHTAGDGWLLQPASVRPVQCAVVVAAAVVMTLFLAFVLPLAEATLVLHETGPATAARVALAQLGRQAHRMAAVFTMQLSAVALAVLAFVVCLGYFAYMLYAAEAKSSLAVRVALICLAPPLCLAVLAAWSLAKGWMVTIWPVAARRLWNEGVERSLARRATSETAGEQPEPPEEHGPSRPRSASGCMLLLTIVVGVGALAWVTLLVLQGQMLQPFAQLLTTIITRLGGAIA